MSHFVPWDIVERIISAYTGDMHVCPIKKISFFIECNEDNLNIFEVGESTFNGDKVTKLGWGKKLLAHKRNG